MLGLIKLIFRLTKDQLPLAPPVLIGFFMAPEDLVFDFAINFEAPA